MYRTEQVWINSSLSDLLTTSTGSPQGYVLSLLLFIFYSDGCRSTQPNCHPLQVFWRHRSPVPPVRLLHAPQTCSPPQLVEWCHSSCLERNVNKTKKMAITSPGCKHHDLRFSGWESRVILTYVPSLTICSPLTLRGYWGSVTRGCTYSGNWTLFLSARTSCWHSTMHSLKVFQLSPYTAGITPSPHRTATIFTTLRCVLRLVDFLLVAWALCTSSMWAAWLVEFSVTLHTLCFQHLSCCHLVAGSAVRPVRPTEGEWPLFQMLLCSWTLRC